MSAGARVLLIDPGRLGWREAPSPLAMPIKPALLALFSHLRRHGVRSVELLDLEREELAFPDGPDQLPAFEQACRELLSGYDFDVAAISCLSTYSYQSARLLGRLVRQQRPGARIAVGGWHALSEPGDFARPDDPFDVIVRGAGEGPLLQVALGRLGRDGARPRVVEAPRAPAGGEYLLTELVQAAPRRYAPGFAQASVAMLPISRGCPYGCRFCGNSLQPWRGWEPLSVEASLALVAQARAALPRLATCYYGDAVFGAERGWRRSFLRELGRRHGDLAHVVITRADLLQPEDVELLALSPVFVVLGVESLAARTLRVMGKTARPERYVARTREVVGWLRAAGVPHELFLILDHPGEDEASLRETFDNVSALVGPGTSLFGFRYMHLPQFARRYAGYQARFGTEFRAPLRWWSELVWRDAASLESAYLPARQPGEGFAAGQARFQRALEPLERLCRRQARRRPHGEVVRELRWPASPGARA